MTNRKSSFDTQFTDLINPLPQVLSNDKTSNRRVTLQLLDTLKKFGANLLDYLHILLPPMVKLFDAPDIPLPVRIAAFSTVNVLTGNWMPSYIFRSK